MATLKHVTVIHPKFGDILNESFIDDIQFKLFLNIFKIQNILINIIHII